MKILPLLCAPLLGGVLLIQPALAQVEYPPETHALPIPAMKDLPVVDGPFQGSVDSLGQFKAPDWFRDGKFGIWAHWGPQAVAGDGDWFARHMYEEGSYPYTDHVKTYGHPSTAGYKDIIPLWKAEKWDPDHLMELYKAAGAHYFVAQAVHHDNFDNWDSTYHKWNSVNMGPHKDMIGLWQQAAKKQGLPFGFSEHLGHSFTFMQASHGADKQGPFAGKPYDGNNPAYWDLYQFPAKPGDDGWYSSDPRWAQEWYARIYDVVTKYKPDLLYSDGGTPYGQAGINVIAQLYNLSVKEHGSLQAVYCCKKNYSSSTDFYDGTCVQDLERGEMNEIQPFVWQTDTSTGDWYYNRRDSYKSSNDVIHTLVDIVSKNGNLLLNVVLYPDGSLPPEMQTFLSEMADWMHVNGDAIFGTRPWTIYGEGSTKVKGGAFSEGTHFTATDLRFTRKGSDIYVTTLGLPTTGSLVVRALSSDSPLVTGDPSSVTLLGAGDVKWTRTTDGMTINLPNTLPCKSALCFKISGLSTVDNLPVQTLDTFKDKVMESGYPKPGADGSIHLEPTDAKTEGGTVKVESFGGVSDIGWWQKAEDSVSWKFKVTNPGSYKITLEMGSPDADTPFTVQIGNQKLEAKSINTGDYSNYKQVEIGSIQIETAGIVTMKISPKSADTWKPLNIRSIILTPGS